MAEDKDKVQEPQAETPEQQAPKAEENKKKQKKEERKADELRKQLAELSDNLAKEKENVAKEKESYLRLMAEFETFRRRSAEDRLNLIASASAKTIEGLLPVLDDCERAMEMLSKSSDDAAKEGTALIYNKLMDYLKTQGLARIEAKEPSSFEQWAFLDRFCGPLAVPLHPPPHIGIDGVHRRDRQSHPADHAQAYAGCFHFVAPPFLLSRETNKSPSPGSIQRRDEKHTAIFCL